MMGTVETLWAKLGDDVMPDMAMASDVLRAFKAGRIDAGEANQLVGIIDRRTKRYLAAQGYPEDE